jgi:hypothetical protein
MRLRHLALATVRDWLGHKDISTTSRYLKSTTAALDAARDRSNRDTPWSPSSRMTRSRRDRFARKSHTPADRPISSDPSQPAEVSINLQFSLVSLNFASWNHLDGWLRQLDGIRRVA